MVTTLHVFPLLSCQHSLSLLSVVISQSYWPLASSKRVFSPQVRLLSDSGKGESKLVQFRNWGHVSEFYWKNRLFTEHALIGRY